MTTRRLLSRTPSRLQPIAVAALLALGASSLGAAPRTFTGGGSGSFWDLVANWTGGILPGVGDDAILGGFNTEFRTGSLSINSLIGTGTLTTSGGTLSLASASSTGNYIQTGGLLTGAGNFTVTGTATLGGGQMTGAGETLVNGLLSMANFSSLALDDGRTLRIAGGAVFQNNTVNLNPNNTGNAAAGRIVNTAGSTITDNSSSGSNFFTQNFGGVDNGASASFTNLGTYAKNGAGSSNIGLNFINSGTVNVNAGTLTLSAGSSHTSATLAGAGTLSFTSGVHNLDAATSVTTANVSIGGGTVNVLGTYNVGGTTTVTSSGTLNLQAPVTSLGNAFTINGGQANLNGNNVSVNALTMSGGVVNGSGNLTVNAGGTASFNGGQMTGTGQTILNALLTTGNFASVGLDEGRTLLITAGATFQNNSVNLNPFNTGNAAAGRIVNAAGSTLTDNSSSGSNFFTQNFGTADNGASASFTNLGTYTKAGIGASNIGTSFLNSGTVNVNAGTLTLSAGSTHTGATLGGAGTLSFSSGVHDLDAASTVSTANVTFSGGTANISGIYNVPGTTTFSGGTVNLPAVITSIGSALVVSGGQANLNGNNLSVNALTMSGGVINGGGNLTVNAGGTASFNGGQMTGTGQTSLNALLTMGNFASVGLDEGRMLLITAGAAFQNNSVNLNPFNTGNAAAGRIVNAAGSTLTDNSSSGSNFFTQNFGTADNGASASFTNLGTYTKAGIGVSNIGTSFLNSGTVNVNAGTLTLSATSTHSGSIGIGSGATLNFSSGTHALDNAAALSNAGTLLVGGGTVNLSGNMNSAGLVSVTSGSFAAGSGNHQTDSFSQGGGTLSGSGDFTVSGAATLVGGAMVGSGRTVLNGAMSTGNFSGITLDDDRTLLIAGGATLQNNSFNLNAFNTGNAAAGRIVNAAGSTITDNSSSGSNFFTQNFGGTDNGASASFTNLGTFTKTGAGTTTISANFINSGTLNVNGGTVTLSAGGPQSGSFNIATGATLSFSAGTHALNNAAGVSNTGTLLVGGGTVNLSGNLNSGGLVSLGSGTLGSGSGNHQTASFSQGGGTLSGSGDFTVSGAATLTGGAMTGSGRTVLNGTLIIGNFTAVNIDDGRTLLIAGGATLQNNSFNLNPFNTGNATAGRIVNAAGSTITDGGSSGSNFFTQNFGGVDNGASASFTNLGTYSKTGSGSTSLSVAVANEGSFIAGGGQITFVNGLSGAGTLATAGTGIASIGANSFVGSLQNNGSGAGALNLQALNITVSGDYTNASFGSGNTFNRRANVATSGTGNRIIAAGDVNQAIAGAQVTGGTSTAPTLTFGNVHVGATTRSYEIVNSGSSGPALRGAVQTAVNGANLSDARLSGSGVTAGNWGPVVAGAALARDVTLTVNAAGVYAPLTGQSVRVLNNFDNTRSQLLTIGSAAGAAAYNLAAAAAVAPNPVQLANQRVGMALAGALNISNTAPTGSFTEGLNASFGALSGAALNNGGAITLLAGGASNGSAMALLLDTSTAGSKAGAAQINFTSDGSGSSGLGLTGLPSQTVSVSGDVYRLASASAVTPATVVLGNVRQGGVLSQALTLANTATADGFSERLNASITATAGLLSGGSFSGLAAGNSSSSLFVAADTAAAGAKSGTATITLASDGTGTSGFAPLALGTQVVNVSATVYRLASASAATPNPVVLADQRVGGSLTQTLSLANTALADGFSERLNASITASGSATASGAFNLLAAGSSSTALAVGVDTGSAGAKSGSALITLASDGTGTSGFAAFGLASQSVNVAGNVYRLAVPLVDTTPLVLLGRVGDATLQAAITATNNAPDLFTERLNAGIASTPAGTVAGSALVGLAPNASGSLQISLPTATAGSFSGAVGVALVSSSAGTTSGAPDFALGTVNVGLTGRVYAPAVAQVAPTVVDFGTVRVGDVIGTRGVTVGNAASGALTDTLRASITGGGGAFSSSGTVAGLVAGSSNASSLQVQLSTGSAGVFTGNATVQLTSQNPDLADLALAAVNVQLQGQVNNLANATLAQAGGSGSFGGTAFSYTLNFGTVLVDTGTLSSTLTLTNAATGPADALAGSWNLAALAGGPFSVAGFEAFTGLAAGSQLAGLTVSFEVATEGSFNRTVVLNGLSTNGSGPDLALNPITLQLQGTVVAVPEPGTYLMMAVGVLMMGSIARRKMRAQRG